jgi:putative membrane protein
VGINDLPHLNATLNAVSGALISAGYLAIRARRVTLHKTLMLSACVCAVLFLTSYITYHYHRTRISGLGPTRFQGQGVVRPIYFTVLISHTILAAATLPLVAITVVRALRGRLDKHKRIARWTLPIWLYVSVTGVLVYFMLYHWFAAPG